MHRLAIFVYTQEKAETCLLCPDQVRVIMVSFWGLHYAPRNDHKGARAPPFLQEETDVTEPGSHHRSHTARTPRTEAVEEIPSRPGSRAECLHMLSNVHLKADERAVSSKHLAVPRCVTAGQKGSTEASSGESR